MNANFNVLFLQPIDGAKISIQEILMLIRKAFQEEDCNESQQELLKLQQHNEHLNQILKCIYCFDLEQFGMEQLNNLLIYCGVVLRNLSDMKVEDYIIAVHCLIKWHSLDSRGHLENILEKANARLEMEVQNDVFVVIMNFMLNQLDQISLETSLSILAILRSIINHVQNEYDMLIAITTRILSLQYEDQAFIEYQIAYVILFAQKMHSLKDLACLIDNEWFLNRFYLLFKALNNQKLLDQMVEILIILQSKLNSNPYQGNLVFQIIGQLLGEVLEKCCSSLSFELFHHCLEQQFYYPFFSREYQKIHSVFIARQLEVRESEREEFSENPYNFLTLQRQVTNHNHLFNAKCLAASLLTKLAQRVDDYLFFVYTNLPQYSFQVQVTLLTVLKGHVSQRQDYFQYLLSMVETNRQILCKKYHSKEDLINKTLFILLCQQYATQIFQAKPNLYKYLFAKVVKLNSPANQCKALKIQANQFLFNVVHIAQNQLYFDKQVEKIAYYLAHSDEEVYFQFIQKMLSKYPPLAKQHAKTIFESVNNKMKECIRRKNSKMVIFCLNIYRELIHHHEIEECLVDILLLILETKQLYEYLDDVIDIVATYIKYNPSAQLITTIFEAEIGEMEMYKFYFNSIMYFDLKEQWRTKVIREMTGKFTDMAGLVLHAFFQKVSFCQEELLMVVRRVDNLHSFWQLGCLYIPLQLVPNYLACDEIRSKVQQSSYNVHLLYKRCTTSYNIKVLMQISAFLILNELLEMALVGMHLGSMVDRFYEECEDEEVVMKQEDVAMRRQHFSLADDLDSELIDGLAAEKIEEENQEQFDLEKLPLQQKHVLLLAVQESMALVEAKYAGVFEECRRGREEKMAAIRRTEMVDGEYRRIISARRRRQ